MPLDLLQTLAALYGTRERLTILCARAGQSPIVGDCDDPIVLWAAVWAKWKHGGVPDLPALLRAAASDQQPPSAVLRAWLAAPEENRLQKQDPRPMSTGGEHAAPLVYVAVARSDAADVDLAHRLIEHLRVFVRRGQLRLWSDGVERGEVQPGDPVEERRREALDQAKAAVLILSSAFTADELLRDCVLPHLTARHVWLLPLLGRQVGKDALELCRVGLSKLGTATGSWDEPLEGLAPPVQSKVLADLAELIARRLSSVGGP